MKKIIAILFLCVTGFACAQSVPAAEKNVSREHRGFYNSASFGFAYNFFDNSREDFDDYERDRKRHDIDYYEFNGFSFSHVELKFGYAFGNLLALHTVFNFGFYMGPLDDYDRSYLVTCYENMACIDVRKDEDEDDPDLAQRSTRSRIKIHRSTVSLSGALWAIRFLLLTVLERTPEMAESVFSWNLARNGG